jgi:Flp pilus assembly protein TadD
MTHSSHKDDTKLLLAVAGLVVTGAAGLAIIAGLGSDEARDEQAPKPVARAVAPKTPEPVVPAVETVAADTRSDETSDAVLPASFGGATVAGVEAEAEPGTAAVEPSIEIEPGENLVAGGVSAWSARDYPRAVAYFRAQTEAREDDAWAHYMLGLSLWKDGRADDAVPALERSVELNPQSLKGRINLSRVQNDRGEFQAALEAARAALEIDPESAAAWFLEGRSLRNLGDTDGAIRSLEASLAHDSENGFVYNLLGLIRIERGDVEAAVESMERAVDFEPDVAYVQNNLGMALEQAGDRAGAVAAYRRAVELDAGQANAASNLARLEPGLPAADPLGESPVEQPVTVASATVAADSGSSDPPAKPEGDEKPVEGDRH